MSKRSGKLAEVKSLALSQEDQVVVALDVHKRSVYAALRRNGREECTWVMPMRVESVVAALQPFAGALKKVVYEAGPTGYGLARAFQQAGLPISVIAPGKTPQPANPGSKSDRLDCRQLAEYAEKGLLKPVAIPTQQEEDDRQMVRLRSQLTDKQRRVKQQIKSLLLQQGVPEPEGLDHWTQAGMNALKALRLRRAIRYALDTLVTELELLMALRKQTEQGIERLVAQKRHRRDHEILRSHPGVGPISASAFALEVYQPERFERSEELASYVGLAPRVRQSGQTRREGPLIKAGREKLRALLIEASWRWIRDDARARRVYRRLVCNTGSGKKAIVAMARRMAVNLWCMLLRQEVYRRAA